MRNASDSNKRHAVICFSGTIIMVFFLVSCAEDKVKADRKVKDSAPAASSVDIDSIPNAKPRKEPKSKYGNPESYEVFGKRYYVMDDNKGFVQKGIASWYGKKFHGRRTSSGETYDMYAMTAAHKTLPLPTYVEVTNLKNKKSIIVKVNDRGPFHENRIIDLSYTAARKLDIVKAGTGLVEIRAIGPGHQIAKTEPETVGAPVRTSSRDSGAGGFFIQVGAFGNLQNAERLQSRLAESGNFPVHINKLYTGGNVIHRVQLGPFYDIDSADSVVEKLSDHGVVDHHIVVE